MPEAESIRPFGPARATVKGSPLSNDDINEYNDYFKASCYLALGMIYLKDNPLLREPLKKEHLKPRLLGHFGSAPGQIFTYMHFNRLIKKYDLDAYFVSGPGHGAPAILSQSYLEVELQDSLLDEKLAPTIRTEHKRGLLRPQLPTAI